LRALKKVQGDRTSGEFAPIIGIGPSYLSKLYHRQRLVSRPLKDRLRHHSPIFRALFFEEIVTGDYDAAEKVLESYGIAPNSPPEGD
jgi:hypothetical protein